MLGRKVKDYLHKEDYGKALPRFTNLRALLRDIIVTLDISWDFSTEYHLHSCRLPKQIGWEKVAAHADISTSPALGRDITDREIKDIDLLDLYLRI